MILFPCVAIRAEFFYKKISRNFRSSYRYQEINIMIIKVQKLVGQSGNSMVEGEYSENFHGNVFGVYYTTFNMKSQ